MNMSLVRGRFDEDGIYGQLLDSNGSWVVFTIEHSYNLTPKLPDGIYSCVRGIHVLDHHPEGFETFQIIGVPGHEGILIHRGNTQDDSDGCVLIGTSMGDKCILNSENAYLKLMALQVTFNSFTLTVSSQKR